jgi:hypothetical protein
MQGGRFRLQMDNMSCVMSLGGKVPQFATGGNAPKSVLGGSKTEKIQEWVIKLLDLAKENNISILAQWVPRSQNERSDWLSRIHSTEKYEYCIRDSCFRQLDQAWGPHSIDIFSTASNVKVSSGRFCSRYFDSNAEWTDAFSRPWQRHEVIWAHPPPKFIGETISHFIRYKCSGTLFTPMWKGSSWWPLLWPRGSTFGPAPFISDVRVLGLASDVLDGRFAESSSNMKSSLMIAFRFQDPLQRGRSQNQKF